MTDLTGLLPSELGSSLNLDFIRSSGELKVRGRPAFWQPPLFGRKLVSINRSSSSRKSAAPKGPPVRKCDS